MTQQVSVTSSGVAVGILKAHFQAMSLKLYRYANLLNLSAVTLCSLVDGK
jgi:hypothetical protein